jgi:predicted secreted acid phosphatase
VLLLIGDDLNDFASATTLGIELRMKLATQHAARWERQWVLIPNGIYGSWERAITSGAKSDEEALARKRRIVKGFR